MTYRQLKYSNDLGTPLDVSPSYFLANIARVIPANSDQNLDLVFLKEPFRATPLHQNSKYELYTSILCSYFRRRELRPRTSDVALRRLSFITTGGRGGGGGGSAKFYGELPSICLP